MRPEDLRPKPLRVHFHLGQTKCPSMFRSARQTKRLRLFPFVFFLVLLAPSVAYSLPTAPVLLFSSGILYQLAVIAILLIPFGFRKTRNWLILRFSNPLLRASAYILPVAALLATVAYLDRAPSFVDDPDTAHQLDLAERIDRCAPVPLDLAERIGIPAGGVLLDPRSSASFASYHLEGSCNFTTQEIATAPQVLDALAMLSSEVWILHEEVPFIGGFIEAVATYRGDEPSQAIRSGSASYLGLTWHASPIGLKDIYKHGLPSSGCGIRTDHSLSQLVVDSSGTPVGLQIGPLSFMGFAGRIEGVHPGFVGLSRSMIAHAHDLGLPIVSIQEEFEYRVTPTSSNVVLLPVWDAELTSAEFHLNESLESALLVCRSQISCHAAAALSSQLGDAGRRLIGVVVLPPGTHVSSYLSNPVFSPGSSLILVWGALILVCLLCPFCFFALQRVAIRHRPTEAGWTARLLPFIPLAVFPILLFFGRLIARRLVSGTETPDWFVRSAYSPGAGLPALIGPFLLCLTALLLIYLSTRILRVKSLWINGGVLIVCCVLAVLDGPLGTLRYLTLFQVALLCSMVTSVLLWPVLVDRIERARLGGEKTPFRLVSLATARYARQSGSKIGWLAEAKLRGIDVPESRVLLGQASKLLGDGFSAPLKSCLRSIPSRLGPGPYVVRSSAPDEDSARGGLTPGKYKSLPDQSQNDLFSAVREVVQDYITKGVSPEQEVAVLIQSQLKGRLAGVALREPARLGGGILVEADDEYNFAITSGKRSASIRKDRIGVFSNAWLSGELASSPLRTDAFHAVFAILEAHYGTDVEIEWTVLRKQLVLLQARPSPTKRESAPTTHGSPATALYQTGSEIYFNSRRANAIVLDRSAFDDFFGKHSVATVELLDDLYQQKGLHGLFDRLWLRLLTPLAPAPCIVSVEGGCYRNLSPSHVFTNLVFLPFGMTLRAWYRLFPARLARRLISEFESLETPTFGDSRQPSKSVREAAERLIEARDTLLHGPAPICLAIATLIGLEERRKTTDRSELLKEHDPFLADYAETDFAAKDTVQALGERFPHRALPDLALEVPRMGESATVRSETNGESEQLSSELPSLESNQALLAHLRGLCRHRLGLHCARLRYAYQSLARLAAVEDGFSIRIEQIREVAAGERGMLTIAGESLKPSEGQTTPPRVTLRELEYWAAWGVPKYGQTDGRLAGVWVGEPKETTGQIVMILNDIQESLPSYSIEELGDHLPLVVLSRCSVETIAKIPRDWGLLVECGSILSHAALIVRQRNVIALFNVDGALNRLNVGDVVDVDRRGFIRKAERPEES